MSVEKKKNNWWWPNIDDVESAKQAAKGGFWASIWVAAVTSLFATIAIVSQKDFASINGFAFFDAVMFAVIAWRIKFYSKVFSILGLILFVVEKIVQASTQGGAGWVLAIILLLMFINGVRGVFAYHKFSIEPPTVQDAK